MCVSCFPSIPIFFIFIIIPLFSHIRSHNPTSSFSFSLSSPVTYLTYPNLSPFLFCRRHPLPLFFFSLSSSLQCLLFHPLRPSVPLPLSFFATIIFSLIPSSPPFPFPPISAIIFFLTFFFLLSYSVALCFFSFPPLASFIFFFVALYHLSFHSLPFLHHLPPFPFLLSPLPFFSFAVTLLAPTSRMFPRMLYTSLLLLESGDQKTVTKENSFRRR